MKKPLITILIRHTEKRAKLLQRCIESIKSQTYKNIDLFISVDFDCATIPFFTMQVDKNTKMGPYYYNDYCNRLKNEVYEGYFFFLDDDDYLANPKVLEQLVQHLQDDPDGIVCQMKRDSGKIKPSDELIATKSILSGKIGLPCLVLRHDLKQVANILPCENGDFLWIDAVSRSAKLKFINQVVVQSPRRNYGI